MSQEDRLIAALRSIQRYSVKYYKDTKIDPWELILKLGQIAEGCLKDLGLRAHD